MLISYLILFVIWMSLLIWSRLQVDNFLKRHSRIADTHSLKDLKRMVRQQMYAALLSFAIGIPMLILSFFLLAKGLNMCLLVLILSSGSFLFIRDSRQLEIHVRSLECQTTELSDVYQKVCQAWVKEALPNF